MRPIQPQLKKEILADPAYHGCMRNAMFNDHLCRGRITWEHAFVYSGKQINEKWAIMGLCAWAHDVDEYQGGGNLDKEKNRYVCLMRATAEDLAKYPNEDWEQMRMYLIKKYGLPKQPTTFDMF